MKLAKNVFSQEEDDCGESCSGSVYFDERKRLITVSGEITFQLADTFFNTLSDFEPKTPKEKPLPLSIYINNCGGELSSAFKMCDHMRNSPCPITTIVAGLAFSGGLMLFAAGDRRLVFPHATLGFHLPYKSSEREDPYEAHANAVHHRIVWMQIFNMFKGIVNINKTTLESYFRASVQIDAGRAIEIGLAHAIISPPQKKLPASWQKLINR